MSVSLPALTLPDPVVSGEGVLDPLGLSNLSDRLADELLPGLRARMNRLRFVTAIAVSAAVVEGLEDEVAKDEVTTAELVFEWLLVQGFVRAGDRAEHRRTPGIHKATEVVDRGLNMSAKTYLKVPTVFGFHGVYKVLAQDLEIIDSDMRLLEHGRALVETWEAEQGLSGFIERATPVSGVNKFKGILRSAVERGLAQGYVDLSGGWQGWAFFAHHLQPSRIGRNEAALLRRLLLRQEGGTRGAVLQLLEQGKQKDDIEKRIALEVLRPKGSVELKVRLAAIEAFENFCAVLEGAFDWIRHRSNDPFQPLSRALFATHTEANRLAAKLRSALAKCDDAIAELSPQIQMEFHETMTEFNECRDAGDLFEATLLRHHNVQSRKPPDGKRDWIERTASGDVIVRPQYRHIEEPEQPDDWPRPYRIRTALQFTQDMKGVRRGGPNA